MIDEIKSAIANKLKELYPTITRYTDDNIPQNFSKPSFYVTDFDMEYHKRLNRIYKSIVSFDIAYFSDKGTSEIKSDCISVREKIMRGFDFISTYKAINKKATITDNVLHITFDIIYSEMKEETSVLMQTQTTNTNL